MLINITAERILSILRKSQYWTDKTRDNGRTISRLICPECGDKEAWAYNDAGAGKAPFSINCNSLDNCGARSKVFDLFPELRANAERDAPPTPEDPHAPARYYLGMRGFLRSLAGLEFEYWKDVRGLKTGAVMFPIVTPDGNRALNGRLFNPPKGEGKTHNHGSTSGAYWKHPGIEYDRGKETFVTEGILNALALIEMGFQAVAILAAGQDPGKVDLGEFPNKVLAFDGDKPGADAFRKWRKEYPAAGMVAAMKDRAGDWNDLLMKYGAGRGDETPDADDADKARRMTARGTFDKNRALYEHNARLLTAEDAESYAVEWFGFNGAPPGLFEFKGRYWYAGKEISKEDPVRRVSDFTVSVDSYVIDETDPERPEYKYRVQMKRADRTAKTVTLSALDLNNEGAIRTAFLARGNTLWEGGRPESMSLARRITRSGAPEIRQLSTVGFDPGSGGYVFGPFMVARDGRLLEPDHSRGVFQVSAKAWVRAAKANYFAPAKVGNGRLSEIYGDLAAAWGHNARIAMAWAVASWFYGEIMERLRFFPFASLFGDPQTGKSNLVRVMNAFQCLDDEGLPMAKANTLKGCLRTIAKRNRLFQAMLEESGDRRSKFDYRGFLLPAYNGNPIQVRAAKSNADNETIEMPISAGVLFCQNHEPFETRPEKERVISLRFRESDKSQATWDACQRLKAANKGHLAAMYVAVMSRHNEIREAWPAEFERALKELEADVPDNRIRENHAVVLAFHRLFLPAIGIRREPGEDDFQHDIKPAIIEAALEKIRTCQEAEDNEAGTFLEIMLNHARSNANSTTSAVARDRNTREASRLVVHWASSIAIARDFGLAFQHNDLLGKLKRHPAFVKSGHSYKFNADFTAKTMVFDLGKIDSVGTTEAGEPLPEFLEG